MSDIDDTTRIAVRRATAADVARVAPLFDAYRGFYRQPSDVAAARAFLAERIERDESVVLVAEVGGEIVGFAQLYPSFSSVSVAPIVILNDLYVAEGWRRAGVGRRLIEETRHLAASKGAVRVEIATEHGNAAALALYVEVGFVPDTSFQHLSLDV